MRLPGGSDNWRGIRAVSVQHSHPIAPVPLVLGVFRRLEGATVLARLLPPHPAPGLSCGRGGAARGRAMLDGPHALDTGGQRRDERGMVALRQPGLTRAALPDDRLGHSLEALLTANLNKGLRAVALNALAVSALPTPWLPQAPTTMALYGAYEDAPQALGAPRPADGQSKDGRGDRTQVRLRRGVSGDGGLPLRLGGREGHRSARVEPPVALEEGLALG